VGSKPSFFHGFVGFSRAPRIAVANEGLGLIPEPLICLKKTGGDWHAGWDFD